MEPVSESGKFLYNIQLASYETNQADQKGEITYEEFLRVFETFPWIEQIELANRLQKISPTIGIEDTETKKTFWISMAGDKDEHAFILGYIYFKLKKGFLGLGTPRLLKWQEIRTTDNKQLVLDLIKFYFERNHEEFEFRFRWLELILEKEMQDMTSKNT